MQPLRAPFCNSRTHAEFRLSSCSTASWATTTSLMDQPADTLVVRGEFWKEFVAERMRSRTRVLNVPSEKEVSPATYNAMAQFFF